MPKRKCCVSSIVRNESLFLPIWLHYYSRFFDREDIYVINHGGDDGSVEECHRRFGFQLSSLPWKQYDQLLRLDTARQKQAELLERYEYVLFADADELIVPHPQKYGGLNNYLSAFTRDFVRCKGYSVIHLRDEEAPFNPKATVLQQRSFWYEDRFYDKTLLSRIPLEWTPGFHTATNADGPPDKDVWLVHLHRIDFDLCWRKHHDLVRLDWSEECMRKGYGSQYRIRTIEDFENYYKPKELKKRGWWYYVIFAQSTFQYLRWAPRRFIKSQEASWKAWRESFIPTTIQRIPRILKERNLF